MDTITCNYCPQTAWEIDNDGFFVCHEHKGPAWVEMPNAVPGACYIYLGRVRDKSRMNDLWGDKRPYMSSQGADGYWYSWQLGGSRMGIGAG